MPTLINPKTTWDTYNKTLALKDKELAADLDISIPVDLYGQEKKDGHTVVYDAAAGRWVLRPMGGTGGSGSPGQVAFWTDTTTLSGDNNLFWDNANKRLGIKTAAPSSPLHIAGAIALATRTTTTNTTLGENDCVLLCDASSGPITVSLPPAASAAGRIYVIKKTDATTNAVTVVPAPGEKIDTANAYVLSRDRMLMAYPQ